MAGERVDPIAQLNQAITGAVDTAHQLEDNASPRFEDLSSSIERAASLEILDEIKARVDLVELGEDRDELAGMLAVRRAELAQN